MSTLGDTIDRVLLKLPDDASIFPRAEIARWVIEGFRRLTNQTSHAKTFTAIDLPPRHALACTFSWERSKDKGTNRKLTYSHLSASRECTYPWEAQEAAGATPEDSGRTVTQLWELTTGVTTTDAYYQFALPTSETYVQSVWYDNEVLDAVSTKTLDMLDSKWWTIQGEPLAFSQGRDGVGSYDLYQLVMTYAQAYNTVNGDVGGPRGFSGSRTYSVESDTHLWNFGYSWNGEPVSVTDPLGQLTGPGRRFTQKADDGAYCTYGWEVQRHDGDTETDDTGPVSTSPWTYDVDTGAETFTDSLECGIFRSALSTARQYFPSHQWAANGVARIWGSSDSGLLIHHAVTAVSTLDENDALDMLPEQAKKYLVYYALSILFNRQGEGFDPAMADHYGQRAIRGIALMKKLGKISRRDSSYTRGKGTARSRSRISPPRLPSNYPVAPWLSR